MKVITTILGIIGFLQICSIFIGMGLGLGRASEINKWKMWDLFWLHRIEMFFTKLFTRK
jgi:hypothetical protein